jgi:stage IV sporulation protein A
VERFDIFRDISERTGGSIYIGVVGPVRTGKSTFIKRFMDLLVLPNIKDAHARQRTQDELPQSGAGRTVMTSQPHFVPDEPVEIQFQDNVGFKVRLVDCVGYAVPGALGFQEEGGPRMVRTPWFDHEIPFEQAAEIGTRKVIQEHSTIGLVVVTDGSITDLPRESYVEAEERVIRELNELGKPYLVLLNSTHPESPATRKLAQELEERYGVTVCPVNCLEMTENDILELLYEVLFEFPVREIGVKLPAWVEELEPDHWLTRQYLEAIEETIAPIEKLRDVDQAVQRFAEYDFIDRVSLAGMALGTGTATIQLGVRENLFYQVLQELTGFEITGDHHLIRLMRELAHAKAEYDKFAEALAQLEETGYGIVAPRLEDISFNEPEIVRRGGQFGIKLQASAPSIHMVRANIVTEVTPFVGTEKQGEELARYLTEEFEKDPGKVWNSDFLGKSLQDLVREGIQSKLTRMPVNAQKKLQETLTKILNEGSGGLICIIL